MDYWFVVHPVGSNLRLVVAEYQLSSQPGWWVALVSVNRSFGTATGRSLST
jgi:hypothetical protein